MITWQQLMDGLSLVLGQAEPRTGSLAELSWRQSILTLLNNYKAQSEHFEPYAFFHHSGYTKNLVLSFGHRCNVIVMCWAPGQLSHFHGHEGSKCFVKVLAGQLTEQQVPYPSETNTHDKSSVPPGSVNERVLVCDQVSYIDDSIGLHKVTNKSSRDPAVTLHIYLPAYKNCRIFLDEGVEKEVGNSQQRCESETGPNLSTDRSKIIPVTFFSQLGTLVSSPHSTSKAETS